MTFVGGNRYTMVVRDDFLRCAWVYFICHTCGATEALTKCLTDLRVEGVSSEVVVVRSDSGGEFDQIDFEQLCRKRYLKQESSQL